MHQTEHIKFMVNPKEIIIYLSASPALEHVNPGISKLFCMNAFSRAANISLLNTVLHAESSQKRDIPQ